MRKLLIFGLIAIALIISYNIYTNYRQQQFIEKLEVLTVDIKEITQAYYNSLELRNYEEALALVNYEDSSYEEDLEWLRENEQYTINLLGSIEGIYYTKDRKYFVVSLIEVKYNDSIINVNERVYFKRSNDNYLIDKIESSDQFVKHRSNKHGEF